ncbi:MAG: hopanoid biosynthesis-associated protein HpnK [Alphaproteobacteria bacterium]|nr:hopanoid biosynthesis-associated protein HpnK [Alphaproteobacteria bacterium]MDE2631390.1 hopanoid biosynthesis-associated protein HpnK [Alphaproteobacteria bacterium]
MKNLIVTADDFGVAREVNDAVEQAHKEGILTAASLMVSAPETADAVQRAKGMPRLRVGLHLVLVEGRPMLPPAAVPDLVDSGGLFRTDMVRAGIAMFLLPKVRRQLAAEIEAQFNAFAATGLELDHVNAHKHFHLHPTVADLVVRIGRVFGMKAMRVPYEPGEVLRQIEPASRGSIVVELWARRLRRRLAAAGIFSPDRVFGLAWSGAMTTARLTSLLARLPDGTSEIYLHPAAGPKFVGAAPGYLYEQELAALISSQAIDLTKKNNIRMGAFGNFLRRAEGGTVAA